MPLTTLQLFDTVERLPAFTVATALAWLGHDDCRTCPVQVHARADVWLISPPLGGRVSEIRALIDVEFVAAPWSRISGDRVVSEINVCTFRDRIHVNLRLALEDASIAVMGGGLKAVAERR